MLLMLACGRTEPATPALAIGAVDAGNVGPTRPDAGRVDAGRPDASVPLVDAGVVDGGAPEPGPWTPKPCVPGTFSLERTVPLVVFIVDTSDSMAEPFDTSTKAETVQDVFETTIPAWDNSMLMGVLPYPSGPSCGAQPLPVTTPARGQVPAIVAVLGGIGGQSPVAEAVTTAAGLLEPLRAANTSRHLILVTDGFPNCNPALSPLSCVCGRMPCFPTECRDDTRVVERLRDALAMGIPGWVISVDTLDQSVVDLLNAMAIAGGRARPWSMGRVHAHARDGNHMAMNLRAIGDRLRSCSRFSRSVPPADTGFRLSIDGVPVPLDPANGWSWVDRPNGELVLQGRACDALLLRPAARLEAEVRCPP
jgi:hypothetical protein